MLKALIIAAGYKYIHNLGVRNAIYDSNENNHTYVLEPLKPDDPRLKYEEADMLIEDINDSEVIDMTDEDPLITFVVELSENEWDKI